MTNFEYLSIQQIADCKQYPFTLGQIRHYLISDIEMALKWLFEKLENVFSCVKIFSKHGLNLKEVSNEGLLIFLNLDHLKRAISPCEFYLREQSLSRFKRSGKWVEAGLCPFHMIEIQDRFISILKQERTHAFHAGKKAVTSFPSLKINMT